MASAWESTSMKEGSPNFYANAIPKCSKPQLDTLGQVCDPSTWELEARASGDHLLGYILSSRPAWATWGTL